MGTTVISKRPMAGDILVNIYDDGGNKIKLGGKDFFLHSDDKFGTEVERYKHDTAHPGMRPRWGKVLATSTEAEDAGISVGDKVLLEQLKWSRDIGVDALTGEKVWRIASVDVLAIDDDGFTDDELAYIESKRT